jgi:hypothetical protein
VVLLESECGSHFPPEVKSLHRRVRKGDGHGVGDIFGTHFLSGFWLDTGFNEVIDFCPKFGVVEG